MSGSVRQAGYRIYPGEFDLFALVEQDPATFPALLQSTARSLNHITTTSHYDILFCYPRQTLRKTGDGHITLDDQPLATDSFLDTLDDLWRRERQEIAFPDALPFRGGWFVYLGYELAAEIEPKLRLPRDHSSHLPTALALRVGAAIIYDHRQQQTMIITEPDWADCLDELEQKLYTLADRQDTIPEPLTLHMEEDPPQAYLDNVQRILGYIREGDVFQVNLSRRWHGAITDTNVPALYRRLRTANPGPFAGYLQHAHSCVLSSSPERLVRVRQNKVETRPIAGTRPRNPDHQQDAGLKQELIENHKERAEHVMLIDLERNDLGRICIPGSVRVDEKMIVESYAHVHHIVSNISGQLRADATPAQVIAAVFPGGTITGCPKVRCMEIIAELEAEARGAYTGAFGYLNHNGDLDLNILIRTIVYDQGELSFRAGAGIVADSSPAQELQETRAKANGMLLAITGRTSV